MRIGDSLITAVFNSFTQNVGSSCYKEYSDLEGVPRHSTNESVMKKEMLRVVIRVNPILGK